MQIIKQNDLNKISGGERINAGMGAAVGMTIYICFTDSLGIEPTFFGAVASTLIGGIAGFIISIT